MLMETMQELKRRRMRLRRRSEKVGAMATQKSK